MIIDVKLLFDVHTRTLTHTLAFALARMRARVYTNTYTNTRTDRHTDGQTYKRTTDKQTDERTDNWQTSRRFERYVYLFYVFLHVQDPPERSSLSGATCYCDLRARFSSSFSFHRSLRASLRFPRTSCTFHRVFSYSLGTLPSPDFSPFFSFSSGQINDYAASNNGRTVRNRDGNRYEKEKEREKAGSRTRYAIRLSNYVNALIGFRKWRARPDAICLFFAVIAHRSSIMGKVER